MSLGSGSPEPEDARDEPMLPAVDDAGDEGGEYSAPSDVQTSVLRFAGASWCWFWCWSNCPTGAVAWSMSLFRETLLDFRMQDMLTCCPRTCGIGVFSINTRIIKF